MARQNAVCRSINVFIVTGLAFIMPFAGYAETEAPAGLGQAAAWIRPCELLEKQIRGETLTTVEGRLATLCQGAFTGIMAVNYVSPPYLPFCEGDNDRVVDYVRAFLQIVKANPEFATKKFGLVVLAALGRQYPVSACGGSRLHS
jgi:hypothetical protein